MPFTLAHPAAVLPLKRLRMFDVLPLIIGSVTPDIGYYFPRYIRLQLPVAHSFVGSLTFCLPVALGVVALLVPLRIPMLEPLPTGHRQFVASHIERFMSRKRYLVAAVPSILVGVWTHLIWDSFTHRNGWAVRQLVMLRATLQLPLIGSMEVFRVLQYISSVVGLAVIAVCYVSAQRDFVREHKPFEVRERRTVLLGALLALSVAVAAYKVTQLHRFSFYRLSIVGLTSGVAVFCVAWFVAGLALVTLRASQPASFDR